MPNFNKEKTEKLKKIDNILRIFFRKKDTIESIDKDKISSVFLICFFLIGDTFMYLPVLRTIRKNFPKAKITIACSAPVQMILQDQNIIDEFVVVNCPWITMTKKKLKDWALFFKSAKEINKNKKFDLAIDFRGDWRNIFYMNFINAERKISYNYTGGEYMLTDVVNSNHFCDHYTDEAFYMIEQIGCKFSEKDKIPELIKSEKSINFQTPLLANI